VPALCIGGGLLLLTLMVGDWRTHFQAFLTSRPQHGPTLNLPPNSDCDSSPGLLNDRSSELRNVLNQNSPGVGEYQDKLEEIS
jgi:hypothetical protein